MPSERVRTCIPARFRSLGVRGEGLIQNVSPGGLFVGTSSIPEVGDPIEVLVEQQPGREVRISGLVWWTTKYLQATSFSRPRGFGVRLLEEGADARQLLGA
jgi:Tfp pilus assembly protein PilZ